ncbi:hypothetical protein A2U01_0102780, partial [Trifolium medium]|nr:hypothetical protein [Trifolium medium]
FARGAFSALSFTREVLGGRAWALSATAV